MNTDVKTQMPSPSIDFFQASPDFFAFCFTTQRRSPGSHASGMPWPWVSGTFGSFGPCNSWGQEGLDQTHQHLMNLKVYRCLYRHIP